VPQPVSVIENYRLGGCRWDQCQAGMPDKPTTMDGLWEAIQRVWDEIPQSMVDGFIQSFEERRNAVVMAHVDQLNFKFDIKLFHS
jgi:hypothetical protein